MYAPVRAFAATLIVAFLGMGQAPSTSPRVIRVQAERFAFTPSEIRVRSAETVELRIKSNDTAHGFRIRGTDTDVVIAKRGQGETSISFTGSKPGRYTFECSHMCGAGHSFMRGVIIVESDLAGSSR